MKGVLYIDGVDVFSAYGVSVSDYAYADLVCLPGLKPISFNDWHEKNGIDPDLSCPLIDAQEVSIPFSVNNANTSYNAFISKISDGAYHLFNFASLGVTKKLRLKSCGDLDSVSGLSSFTLIFSDDDPMNGYVYSEPVSNIAPLGDFLIDGIDVASYGIRMLDGTMDSINRKPDVKENLVVNPSLKNGVFYDDSKVTFKSRTAELNCFMRASSSQEFWQNRNALLYDLVRPEERVLTVAKIGKQIPCFYKGCSVSCFFPDKGKFWFEFTLSLEFFKGVI